MKKLCILFFSLLSFSCFAGSPSPAQLNAADCGMADLSSPNFCSQFQVAARCNCAKHLGAATCSRISIPALYKMMMDAAHTRDLPTACRFQKDMPDSNVCIQHWTAYGQRCEPLG